MKSWALASAVGTGWLWEERVLLMAQCSCGAVGSAGKLVCPVCDVWVCDTQAHFWVVVQEAQ